MDDITKLGTGEDLFEYLSINRPHDLADMIKNNALRPEDLTFAAEYLGRNCIDSNLVRETLIPLLSHSDVVVREGALIGFDGFESPHPNDEIKKIILDMSINDPSLTIRQITKSMLEDF